MRILGDFPQRVKPGALGFHSARASAWNPAKIGAMRKTVCAVIFLLSLSFPLFGWGEKGHYLVNDAATQGTPPELPSFFHQSYSQLIYLGYEPDRWRGGRGALDAVNPPEHYLDYEYVAGLNFPKDRYKFIELLQTSGTLERYGIDITKPGFAPWRIAELTELLTVEWRLWRAAHPSERQYIEQNIIHVAGVLGHYVADSSNPHHASMNYNGWVEDNPERFRTDCETHVRFETQFVSRVIEIRDVVPKMAAPKLRTDYFSTAMELIRDSNRLVRTLYRIDRDRGFDARRQTPESRTFAAERLGVGASYLRDLWWSAWINSAQKPAR